MNELLTVEEVASRLRLHQITVRRHIKSGRLSAVRIGRSIRVREEVIQRLMHPPIREVTPALWREQVLRPPTEPELVQRRWLIDQILARRDAMTRLDITTTELVRLGRREGERGED